MTSSVIVIENLSKSYPIYKKPVDMFFEAVFQQTKHDLFWALRDVSFKVNPGQRLGIIGPNGAGKSTLLKIISGNIPATSGNVLVNGSISALLSLAPAWNMEESGIENIRFNLMMRGLPNSKINSLIEEIVDFAELGPFIYQPVKTYSSGMSARLTFAIGTAISPEILIIDEVLAVGDGYFAGKSMRRMKEVCDRGKALIFVSHSTAAVRQMCDSAIWLENGSVRAIGPVEDITNSYDQDIAQQNDEAIRSANIQRIKESIQFTSIDDIGNPNFVRFRLRLDYQKNDISTHQIRELRVRWLNDLSPNSISISLDSDIENPMGYLDLFNCEWNRIYTNQGIPVRLLSSRLGARKGGHFLVRRPDIFNSKECPIEIEWISHSELNSSELILEYANIGSSSWIPLTITSQKKIDQMWVQYIASGSVLIGDEKSNEIAQKLASELRLSPIRIIGAVIVNKDGETNSIREKEPFSIQINVECNKNAPNFSMCLQINRIDGVYIFFQPSDFHGAVDVTGARYVTFIFDFSENYFSSDTYEVTATAITAPWHKDIIQSETETFDRKISITRFTVAREYDTLSFGAINYRTRVVVMKSNDEFKNVYPSR